VSQKRLAAGGDPGVHELGDVRMPQSSQDVPFALEPRQAVAVDAREVEQLDGDSSLEPAVAPPCQPDRSHAAFADRRFQRVRAHRLSSDGFASARELTARGPCLGGQRVALVQSPAQIGGVHGVEPAQPGLEHRRVHVQRAVEKRGELLPLGMIEFGDLGDVSQRLEAGAVVFAHRAPSSRGPVDRLAARDRIDDAIEVTLVDHVS
jgi:hypothetical protein